MTANGWLQIALYSVVLLALTKPMGVYMVKVYDGSMGWLRPVERFLYRAGGIDPEEDQHWTKYAAAMLIFSAASMLLTYVVLRLQHVLPLNPQHFPAVVGPPGVRDGGVVHDQHELAVVFGRVDDVVLLADDPARVPQLRLGRGRHGGGRGAGARHRAALRGPARQLLGRSGARHALPASSRSRSSSPWSSCSRARSRTSCRMSTSTRSRAPSRPSRWARSRARNPSSSSAPTAAGSSTPTRRIRSRTRRRGPTSCRCWRSSSISAGLTWTFGRMVKKQAHGWALWAAMFVLFFAGVTTAYWAEARGNPIHAARGIDVVALGHAARRQHGGQGGPVRHRELGPLRHRHHRRVVRLRQQHARLVHADRRSGAAGQHAARRGGLRRRGRRPLRHARDGRCSPCSSPASWSAARRNISARRSRPRGADGDALRAGLPRW